LLNDAYIQQLLRQMPELAADPDFPSLARQLQQVRAHS
jgi:hypothetical protein